MGSDHWDLAISADVLQPVFVNLTVDQRDRHSVGEWGGHAADDCCLGDPVGWVAGAGRCPDVTLGQHAFVGCCLACGHLARTCANTARL